MLGLLKIALFLATPLVTDPEWESILLVESQAGKTSTNIAQIRPVVVEDLNRILGEDKFSYSDRVCVEKSRQMFDLYTNYYAGLDATFEEKARIWNGGPKGYQKSATKRYWKKVDATHKELLKEYKID